jgi:hypothetical protein
MLFMSQGDVEWRAKESLLRGVFGK